MQEFFTSPVVLGAAVALCFLVGWLARQWSLERQQIARLAILERDRDYARSEGKKLSDQVGLLEADLKKSAFDAGQSAERISGLQLEKSGLSDALHHAAVREAKMLADRSDLSSRATALDEQVLGLRTKTGLLQAENARLQDHEAAQKRLRADCGAALQQLGETRKQLAETENRLADLAAETESLRSKIEKLRAKPILLPTIKPASGGYRNGSNGHSNGHENGQNGFGKNSENGPARSNGAKKAARKSLISPESAAALDPVFFEKAVEFSFGDDLKIVNGIGPREEKALAALGIRSVERLAEMTAAEVAELAEGSENLMRKLRKEGWAEQAQHLVGAMG